MDVYEYNELLKELEIKIGNLENILNLNSKKKRVDEIIKLEQDSSFWNNIKYAQKLSKEKSIIESEIESFNSVKNSLIDSMEYFTLVSEENDEEMMSAIFEESSELKSKVEKLEIKMMLNEETDKNSAIISIHPGAGGTESQDWANMLYRMYLRWAERENFKVKLLDYQSGEEAGIKDVSFIIEGQNAYGYLKVENGIHRLVRISPFDSNAKRHTSFSSVIVSPEINDDIDIQILDKDIKVDTYRASGAGGQHVNKTESAIRITHIETNIVVQCQNDRSQHKNRSSAMKVLKSRLYEYQKQKKNDKDNQKEKLDIAWGNQIRSYVLAPYQQVKDSRSNKSFSNVFSILDGDLNKIINSVLVSLK